MVADLTGKAALFTTTLLLSGVLRLAGESLAVSAFLNIRLAIFVLKREPTVDEIVELMHLATV